MKLTLVRDNRGSYSTRVDGVLYVLANKFEGSQFERDQEYMIVGRLGKHPNGYLIEPVTDEYELVEHEGFIMSGSDCRTLAWRKDHGYLTPGRLNGLIHTVDHVNASWSKPIWDQAELDQYRNRGDWSESDWKPNPEPEKSSILGWYKAPLLPARPGAAYVRKGEARVAGVADLTAIGGVQ